jgi:hypothetical protein
MLEVLSGARIAELACEGCASEAVASETALAELKVVGNG